MANVNCTAILGFMASLLIGCAAPITKLERYEYSRLAMGVEARVVLYAPSEDAAIDAANKAFERIAQLDASFSDWSDTSELSDLCRHAGGAPQKISNDLYEVLEHARDMAQRSGGAFDPTVGPLVKLWRAARRTKTLPDSAEIEKARALVDWRKLELDRDRRTARLADAGMQLDLGAIGKGYACDRAIELLSSRGIASALVQMGGDLVCSARPPGRAGWSIDLAPDADHSVNERLEIEHQAVSTSGDREQWFEAGGLRYSHVIDPRTGLALTNRVNVIVLARDGTTGDALSTAAGVLGADAGIALVERFDGCDARIEEHGERGIVRRSTPFLAPRSRFLETR